MNENLQNFFCEKASKRIGGLIKDAQLSFFEIYPEHSSIISWIVKGKRTNKNPYLLTDTATQRISETLNGYDLSDEDRKKNKRILYWGDDNEIKGYIPELMELLAKNLTEEQQLIFDETLMDDIDFAETTAYTEILNEYPASHIDIDKEELYREAVPISRFVSEQELLKEIEQNFREKFIDFLDSSKGIRTKVQGKDRIINKSITFKNQFGSDDIVNLFLEVVKEHKLPVEESIGQRVYSILKKDVSKLDFLIDNGLVHDAVYSSYSNDYIGDEIFRVEQQFQHEIIQAGQDYIKSLSNAYKNKNKIWNKIR